MIIEDLTELIMEDPKRNYKKNKEAGVEDKNNNFMGADWVKNEVKTLE